MMNPTKPDLRVTCFSLSAGGFAGIAMLFLAVASNAAQRQVTTWIAVQQGTPLVSGTGKTPLEAAQDNIRNVYQGVVCAIGYPPPPLNPSPYKLSFSYSQYG